MTKKNVDETIEQRIQQAEDNKIYEKVYGIVSILGRKEILTPSQRRFKEGHLRVLNRFGHTLVTYRGKSVFESSYGQICSYAPGEWEDQVELLYATAIEEEDSTVRSRWGLTR